MELSEFVAGQVLDYVEQHEGFIPTKNLTELADILHSSISQWEPKEIAELREKLEAAEHAIRDIHDVLLKVEQERDRLRKVLEWLNRKGGLGLDVHARIDEALAQPAEGTKE